ncbi:uncharacterized protein LOC134198857 [Bombyx mori]|uniref:uncharacterized protein LOC134198857 n=1 Tax=Bombyx mori TaxID=7091 RepID=UPI002ED36B26
MNKIAVYDTFTTMLLISKYFDVALYCIGFIVNTYVNIAYSNVNVLLYLKLQTIKTFIPHEHKLFLKAVRRLNNVVFYKWSMYGMFIVDATLPRRLIELIATYTVVFLQFAFK